MTRRQRLERKLEKREEWSASRTAKANAASDAAHRAVEHIPLGQPILTNHHSEKRHRRDLARCDSAMRHASEHSDMAAHHAGKAAGLERQLESSIFADDADAIAALEQRIAEREAECAWKASLNKAWRKGGPEVVRTWTGPDGQRLGEKTLETIATTMRLCPWLKVPMDTTNLRANIRRDKERIAEIRRRTAVTATAEEAGGVVIREIQSEYRAQPYAVVTFAEKPDRAILDDLRAAGFRWGAPSWHGDADKIPASVRALAEPAEED
jgi:uncharacterized protein DUF3560